MKVPEIKCAYTRLVPLSSLIPYSRNRNKHPAAQIERLAKLIQNHGLRHPVIVSNLSGQVVAGNGRLEALRLLGATEVPVDYQDFADSDAEYTFSVSDNAVALWAELDLAGINTDLPDLGPFDIDMLGIKDFSVDAAEIGMPDIGDGKDPGVISRTFTLSNEQSDILDEAMEIASGSEDCTDELNQNKNGNILGAILRAYVLGKRPTS